MSRNTNDAERVESMAGSAMGEVLARASVKDRAGMLKHMDSCDAEPDPHHAKLWRRLVGMLSKLAPLPVQIVSLETPGHTALLFFAPDGKYRMQVFSLEDRRDGVLSLYLPDVTEQAIKAKMLKKAGEDFVIANSGKSPLTVKKYDAANCVDPPKHFKHMIGWNRKAVRITLDTAATSAAQVAAAEQLCSLAAEKWSALK